MTILDNANQVEFIECIAPADTAATATGANAIDMSKYVSGQFVLHFTGITGSGGTWTLGLTSATTAAGSYDVTETAASVFVAGAPVGLVNADAGVHVYDVDPRRISRRFVKPVLTESGTISASVLSMVFVGVLKTAS